MAWWLDALADPNNVQGGRFNPFNLARNFTKAGRQDLEARRSGGNAVYEQQRTEADALAERAGYEKAIRDILGPDFGADVQREGLRGQKAGNVAQETGNEAAMFQLGNERSDAASLRQRTGFNTPQAAGVIQNQQQIDQSKTNADRGFEITMLGNENQMAQQNQAQANVEQERAMRLRELDMQAARDATNTQRGQSAENIDLLKQYQDSLIYGDRPDVAPVRGAIAERLGKNGMPLPAPRPDPRATNILGARNEIATPSAAMPADRPASRIEQRPMPGSRGQGGYTVKDYSKPNPKAEAVKAIANNMGPRPDRENRTAQSVSDMQKEMMELFTQLPPNKAAELRSLVENLLKQSPR